MSEEEYMECSVVAYPRQIKFLHINGGAISYYVDRHVSDYVDRLQQENQELKKQLENKYEKVGTLTSELLYEENTKLINQQKKFIKYLEDEIKLQEEINDIVLATGFEEILQKYKETIGDDK